MKSIAVALALLGATAADAAVTYNFESYNPFAGNSVVTSFSLTVNDFFTAPSTEVMAGELTSCSSVAGACGSQYFNRVEPVDLFNNGRDELVSEAGIFGVFHFFELGAFTTLGTHFASNPDIGVTAKLVVSEAVAPVPEPGEWAMIAVGLAVVGGVARRRKRG